MFLSIMYNLHSFHSLLKLKNLPWELAKLSDKQYYMTLHSITVVANMDINNLTRNMYV